MGAERDRGGAGGDGAGVPAADPAAATKAERKAEKQRRAEERRRRWARPDPGATTPDQAASDSPVDSPAETPTADDRELEVTPTGSTAVLTRDTTDDTTDDGPATSPASSPASSKDERAEKKARKQAQKQKKAAIAEQGAADDAAPTTAAPVVPARGPVALWLLLLAAHPRQAVLTAAAFAGTAALAGRPPEQVGLLAAMVLVGQTMLGWHNDLVDRDRDAVVLARHRDAGETRRLRRKPLAEGRLEPGTVWYAFAIAALLLVPLGVSNGVTAGVTYLVVVAIGMVGNISLRHGWFSPVPWAASFALYPAVLSYAGPIGGPEGLAPNPALVGLAAALGVTVHVLRSLPGLVDDNRDGLRHLPLRIALKVGAPRLLGLAAVLAAALVIALLTVASQQGLYR